MEKLNVCYTVDSQYLIPMLVSLSSLVKHNSREIDVYLIYDHFENADFELLNQVVSKFSNVNLILQDAKQIYDLFDTVKIPKWRGTQIANSRLFLPEILPDSVDSFLYLDSDTIVVDCLDSLQSREITKPVSAVLDRMPRTYWQALAPYLTEYYNSGVLQIQSKLWKEAQGTKRILNIIDQGISLRFPDQDILNLAFSGEFDTLSMDYNVHSFEQFYSVSMLQYYYQKHDVDFYPSEEIKQAKSHPIILHATDFYGIRPWHTNTLHPHNELYEHYLYEILGEIEKEAIELSYATMNPKVFACIEYIKLYMPDGVKKNLKKILKKRI